MSCDLTPENYELLHARVASYRASKIAILNVLVSLLADQDIVERVRVELAADS